MSKVYLSPAYHYWNPCVIDGCDETTHNNMIVDELKKFLEASGVEVKRGPRRTPKSDENGDEYMIQAVRESNNWGADVHYVSHTNAFNGSTRYSMSMYYPKSVGGKKLAEMMQAKRQEIYPSDCIVRERDDLYELRATYCTCVYQEHCFHDNAEEAKWLHDHIRDIARADAQVLCEYLGVTFVDPYEGGSNPAPKPIPEPSKKIDEDGYWGYDTTLATQKKLGVYARDGVLSNQYSGNLDACINSQYINPNGWNFVDHVSSVGSDTVRAIQKKVGADVDGVFGPDTVTNMQEWLGVEVDGLMGPATIKAWQRWLNK